jgi:histone acetyltransferase (RNA polymerase elongator complex component)
VTVFTSPYPQYIDPRTGKIKTQRFSCKWNCYYCPNHPDHPRSYLPDEPGCLRAERLHFVAADQLTERVETLRRIGHPVDKLEVLVLGGTWESYPEAYREEFIRDLYWAANTFFDAHGRDGRRGARSLVEEQRINETTAVKIIGLTLETRPDTIDTKSIRLLRKYGCTRVQLGVQHLDDGVLSLVNRGHGKAETVRALQLLKDACFKVDIHIMPDLPGTTPDMDREMFDQFLGVRELRGFCSNEAAEGSVVVSGGDEGGDGTFWGMMGTGMRGGSGGEKELRTRSAVSAVGAACSVLAAPPTASMCGAMCYYEYDLAGPEVQADQWKIYPCEVTPWTVIEKWFKEGRYVPYGEGDSPILRDIIIGAKQVRSGKGSLFALEVERLLCA